MTDIEKKALALLNEVWADRGRNVTLDRFSRDNFTIGEALCRAIERHEAFRQEVSAAASAAVTLIETWVGDERAGKISADPLRRFIIPEPADPLVEAWIEATGNTVGMEPLNEALAKRGGKIVWENSDA